MPRYCYICTKCYNAKEVIKSMSQSNKDEYCDCGYIMERDIRAEIPNIGNKPYGKTFWSDSMAVGYDQIDEHKRTFPDVRVDSEGRIGFDSVGQHDKYLEKTGFIKHKQKVKRGVRKRIA